MFLIRRVICFSTSFHNVKALPVKTYLFHFIILLFSSFLLKRELSLSYVRLNERKLEKKLWDIYTGDGRRSAFTFECMLLISQRRVIARSMDVKSIPAVGADRESAVSDYKYASSRTPFCATSFAGVVRVTEASCKCINTLFAYAAGAKFWLAKVHGGDKGWGGTIRIINSNVTFRKKLK